MNSANIISQLNGMPPERLKKFWFSAMRIAKSGNGDVETARKILDEIEAIERGRVRPKPSDVVGALLFEPHGHGYVSFGYADGACVVTVRKTEQHRLSGNRVYEVKVLGQKLPEASRSIDEARQVAANEYLSRQG